MPRSQDYEAALRELEHLYAEGRIDSAKYEVHRTKLLSEAAKPQLRWWQVPLNILTTLAIVVVIVFVLMALGNR